MKRRFDTRSTARVRDKHPWPRERGDEPIPLFDHFDDTRAAAKSSKCRNRVMEDTWDDYDSIFYNEWLRVSIEPTRFVDPDSIRRWASDQTSRHPHQPEAAFPPFPPMPDMSTRPEGDFQRVVVDALTANWARVSRRRCSSRRSARASSPSAAGPSRQRRGDSEETTDAITDED
ncbi:hypothetical protein F2Q69_00006489 [Brassica cretica]|uniref:Uncharacterized protein n=1 Tax=Brassica cretica TaxID=69181 RepID=A0A8S9PEF3_BRACR|nr:hypothetical protein F2Q69_00006489 [Brassica cretica]